MQEHPNLRLESAERLLSCMSAEGVSSPRFLVQC